MMDRGYQGSYNPAMQTTSNIRLKPVGLKTKELFATGDQSLVETSVYALPVHT